MMSVVTLPQSSDEPILLLDGGYLMFYRVCATQRYLTNQPIESHPTNDEAYLALLVKHLHSKLGELMKKLGVRKGNVYLLRDCPQAENWRLDLHQGYKEHRGTAHPMIRAFAAVMEDALASYGPNLRLPRMEADDLVALTVQRIKALRPEQPLIILANDRDYCQLLRYPGVRVLDASAKDVCKVSKPEEAELELWVKILMGDASDNIPPIVKGVGPKTARKLALDPVARETFVQQKGCQENLERNRRLIDFSRIPVEFIQQFDQARQYILGAETNPGGI